MTAAGRRSAAIGNAGVDREILLFAATLPEGGGQPRAVEHKALRWLSADELAAVDWLPADRVLLPALRELLSGTDG